MEYIPHTVNIDWNFGLLLTLVLWETFIDVDRGFIYQPIQYKVLPINTYYDKFRRGSLSNYKLQNKKSLTMIC